MRKFSLIALMFTLAAGSLRAQDAATQQQIDKLSGQLQDIIDAEAAQSKRLDAMEHEISELRDKVNTPAVNNSASVEELQKLASQVQEIDRKRADDRELILGKFNDLAKIVATAPAPTSNHHHTPAPVHDTPDEPTAGSAGTGTEKSYPYQVQAGDSLSAIIKAFKDKGVKTSLTMVLKANPGLNANTLYVGKTIYIPDASKK